MDYQSYMDNGGLMVSTSDSCWGIRGISSERVGLKFALQLFWGGMWNSRDAPVDSVDI